MTFINLSFRVEYFSNKKTNPSKTNYIKSGLESHESSLQLSTVLNNSFVEEVDSSGFKGILLEKALTRDDHREENCSRIMSYNTF